MIQRIQSIYLLISATLMSILYFRPLAEFNVSNGDKLYLNILSIINNNNQQLFTTYPIVILLIISVLISIITIFLFKNRKLQMRLCIYNIVLMIGMFGLIYYYYKMGIKEVVRNENIQIVLQRMQLTVLSPVIAAFFSYLAYKKILKDEVLIKSIDRIR